MPQAADYLVDFLGSTTGTTNVTTEAILSKGIAKANVLLISIGSFVAFYFGIIGAAFNTYGQPGVHRGSIWTVFWEFVLLTTLLCIIGARFKTPAKRVFWVVISMISSALVAYYTVMYVHTGKFFMEAGIVDKGEHRDSSAAQ